MYARKSGQKTLFDVENWVGPAKQKRLEKSWAGPFQEHVLPLLIGAEPKFASFYSPDRGAPNKPIAVLLGLCLLKEMYDLTDAQVVELFEFSLQWQFALDTPCDSAHVCPKTLYNFRQKLASDDLASDVFKQVVDAVIAAWGLKTDRHRLDSTHLVSNMKVLSRLGLFVKTLEQFLHWLRRHAPEALGELPARFSERYLDREGYFSDAKSSESRRRLEECAQDVWYLVERFRGDLPICASDAYGLLVRLFEDQCEVKSRQRDEKVSVAEDVAPPAAPSGEEQPGPSRGDPPEGSDNGAGESGELPDGNGCVEMENNAGCAEVGGAAPQEDVRPDDAEPEIALKSEIASTSLQSPSDPDATYSGHKGKGYQAQICETCNPGNPFQVIDCVEVEGAHKSDQEAAGRIHSDLIARGHQPETTYADSGYVSAKNILEAEASGVRLVGPASGGKPKPGRLGLGDFKFNAGRDQILECPGGQVPDGHRASRTPGTTFACFSQDKCLGCSLKAQCPARHTRAGSVVQFRAEDVVVGQRRKEQQTPQFKSEYKIRSGIEGTNSQLKNRQGFARTRVRGSPAVRVVSIFKVLGANVWRVVKHALNVARSASRTPQTAVA
jgi:hypothetical protein